MSDRVQMLEAVLNLMDEGVAILDEDSSVLFWNNAAAELTGFSANDLIRQTCPHDLYRVDENHRRIVNAGVLTDEDESFDESWRRPLLVSMLHKLGHSVPGMLRRVSLQDSEGTTTGTALLFYPVEEAGALPHGDWGEGTGVEHSQADMEDRLDAAHHQWAANRVPFGLLWITVNQAETLRKTHGRDACEAMLRTVEQTLLRHMKPAEVLGRWGSNEFLVVAHERSAELLVDHAKRLAGMARTADFRWWGDRVGLTVSIGACQATDGVTLQSLLQSARQAMHASIYAGGNHVTEARES